MATVTFIKYERQSPSALSRVSDYVKQEQKTLMESGVQLISGQNCSSQFSAQEFMATRQMHRKDSPVYFYHYVQSFHPNEPVIGELAHEVAKEFAARAWPESEVLIATHIDAEHIHLHFIVNAVCHESGRMLRQGPTTLKTLRPISDEICMQHGLSVFPKQQKQSAHGMTGREYRAAAKGESWKFQLMNVVTNCMRYARTKDDFIALMRSEGYGVRWEDTRKNITYTLPSGYKCRDDRLHLEKYLKEAMEREFRIRAEIISRGIDESEYAGAFAGEKYAYAATPAAGADSGDSSDAAGVADAHSDAGRPNLVCGEAEPADRTAFITPDRMGDEATGGYDSHGADAASDAARTGWEAERAALFAAPAQTQTAAPVPGAAAHPADLAGALGGVVELRHAVERAQNDVPYVSDATAMQPHIDSKCLRKLREKKIAAGHKPDDHEDYEMKMEL